jgi:hypothetical protein
MRPRHRIIIIAIPVLLLAAEAAYWRIAAGQLQQGYKSWVAEQVSKGWQIDSSPVAIGGWPASAQLDIDNLVLRHTRPAMPGDVNVTASGVVLAVSLFNPNSLEIRLDGPVHVQAGAMPDIVVTADNIAAQTPLRPDEPPSLELRANEMRMAAANQAWNATLGLLDARVLMRPGAPAGQSDPAATFALSASAIALPSAVKWPLGPNISSLSLDGSLNGPIPDTRNITAWAEAWRDGGGSLELKHLTMGWGPLGFTTSATLALDDQLQPMGSGNARIVGYAETLDRLAAAGMLTKSAATAAKAVLSLMAGTSDTDQSPTVDVPLTLQYRTLSMRQVPLVRLPEVDWREN